MVLSDLQTAVNYRRRDVTESFISTTEINYYLNEGLKLINAEVNGDYNITTGTFSYVDGTTTYATSAIGTDVKCPISMQYPTDLDYRFTHVQKKIFDKLYKNAINIYSLVGDNIYVKTSFGTGTISLDYYSNNIVSTSAGYWKEELADATDYPLIPAQRQPLLVSYAAARCYQKEGMMDDFNVAYGEFNVGLKQMKSDFIDNEQRPHTRLTMGSQFGAYSGELVNKDNILGT